MRRPLSLRRPVARRRPAAPTMRRSCRPAEVGRHRHAGPWGSGRSKLPFTPDTIRRSVASKQPEIERCYEQTLAGTDKPVDGKLKTHFVITARGLGEAAPRW